MAAATTKKKRKEEVYTWKAGASSGHITNTHNGHITNLKQSILATFDIYGSNPVVFKNNYKVIKLLGSQQPNRKGH
jgi:hypothetical protein